ncbi:MAG: outer membrane protein assembly factor [Acidobacteriaceae bacterium]
MSSYEGQTITSISLAGRPDLNTAPLLQQVNSRLGEQFSEAKVNAAAEFLKQSGQFETVRLRVDPEPKGISVRFVLEPAMYYGLFQFTGAVKQFGYARLVQITNYPPRGAYDDTDVQNAASAMVRFFNRSGYFLAEVTPKIDLDRQHGLVNVDFVTHLGKRAKFGNVKIQGPAPQQSDDLDRALRSLKARFRGAAIRPGKTYRLKTLQNATQYLNTTLQKQERLAAKVRLLGAKYNADTNRADITFDVQEGPVVKAKVQGAHLWSWTEHRLLPVYAGIGVDPEVIQEGRQNLVGYFQNKGYFDVNVSADVKQQADGQTITYQIEKGPRHKVQSVEIAGNQQFSSRDLTPYLRVHKKHLFNHGDFSQKLVRASVNNVESFYKSNGYSGVKVTPQVTNSGGNIAVRFDVKEGERDVVANLAIQGNEKVPASVFAPDGLKLAPGRPYSQTFANDDRNRIIAYYLNAGYLNASFRETVKQSGQPHRLDVVYQITEGPQVTTANVITLGRSHSQPRLIAENVADIKTRKPLTERDIYTAQSQLYTGGVFDWAEIDPRREITTQTQEDVVIKLHEAPRNQLTYGFGFEVINRGGSVPSGTVVVPGLPVIGLNKNFKTSVKTFVGPRGTVQYTRNNVRGKDESLTFTGFGGRLDQRFSIAYIDPNLRWTKWGQSVQLSGEANQQNPIFSSRLASLAYELKRPLDAAKTQTFFLRYRFQQTGINRLTIPELVPANDRHVKLSTLSANYVRDTRDNSLDAHKGIYETFEASITPKALGSSDDFARLFVQTAYYRKVPKNIIWANSLRLGFQLPFGGSHVPVSEQYFTGGGSTLRGFSLDGAGPQHYINICGSNQCFPTLVPVGGNQLLILNSELRIPIDQVKKGLGVVGFYDGGNVYSRVSLHNLGSNYTNSVGIGLRYSTPVGPVRIDFGHVLNAQPSIIGTIPAGVTNPTNAIKRTNYFITIGQAF